MTESSTRRISIIGHQTKLAVNDPHTVYRTVIIWGNYWHERLIRFKRFHHFHNQLSRADLLNVHIDDFPHRHLTDHTNDAVVKDRMHKLNKFMQKMASKKLSPKGEEALQQLLFVPSGRKDGTIVLPSRITPSKLNLTNASSKIKASKRSGTHLVIEEAEIPLRQEGGTSPQMLHMNSVCMEQLE